MHRRHWWICGLAALAVLAAGLAPTAARPADDEPAAEAEALDELDGLRAEEELLSMTRDAQRQQIRTWLQTMQHQIFMPGVIMGMGGMGGGMGGLPQPGGQPLPEEQQKQIEKQQKDFRNARDEQFTRLKRDFIETSKELARVQRRRAALERKLGVEPAADPALEARLAEIERRLDAVAAQGAAKAKTN